VAVVAVLALRPSHEEAETTPAPVEQTSVSTKKTAPATSKQTTTTSQPTTATTTTKATANTAAKPQATNAVATAKPKQPTLAEMTSDQAYAAGMQYVNQGNWAQALKHLEKAANANHADAAFQLGEMYFGGIGVDANKETAIRWYKVAANAGHKQAKRKLF
jgi:TPR repeat protein